MHTVIVAWLLLTASSTPSTQQRQSAIDQIKKSTNADSAFQILSDIAPETAGFYVEKDNIIVLTTSSATSLDLASDVKSALGDWAANLTPILKPAKYTFMELQTAREQSNQLMLSAFIHAIDIDESSNHVALYSYDADAADRARTLLLTLNSIDADIFEIRIQEPAQSLATLRDLVRPVPGGVQISTGPSICTLGWSTVRQTTGQTGFITCSHCTNTQGGTENTRYGQPDPGFFWSSSIGYEVADPYYIFPTPGCPAGSLCRRSDSAFFRFSSAGDAERGRLAKPTSRCLLPFINCSLSTTAARLTATSMGGFPVAGQTLEKIGRTTGWTAGPVHGTCVTITDSTSGFTFICQDTVDAGSDHGDSGSPVFIWQTSSTISPMGVLWGGTNFGTQFIFSHWSNIEYELGDMEFLP